MNSSLGLNIDGQFNLNKVLGKGFTADVYLADYIPTNTELAVKVYKPSQNYIIQKKNFINEVKAMQAVQHKNVVRIMAASSDAVLSDSEGSTKEVMFVGVELCPGGELFDYIADPGKGFGSSTCRYFFEQLVDGIESIHKAGLVHRDLKTENLFLDDEINLKIGDFGFAKFFEPNKNLGILKSRLGTEGYQSPELIEGDYNGFENDIFAAGVILFIFHFGYPPFRKATSNDHWYKHFIKGCADDFWKTHLKNPKTPKPNDQLRELLTGMLSYKNRFTIDDIRKSQWFRETVVDINEVVEDMKQRAVIVNEKKEAAKIDSSEKMDIENSDEKRYRSEHPELCRKTNYLEEIDKINFEDYHLTNWSDSLFAHKEHFLYQVSPKEVLKDFGYKMLSKFKESNYSIEKEHYKGSFEWTISCELEGSTIPLNKITRIDIDFEVFTVDDNDDQSILQLYKKEMSSWDYKALIEFLKEEDSEHEHS